MAIDVSIYQSLLRPPKTVQEYDNEAQTAQTNALGLQMARAKMGEYQRGIDQENALGAAYKLAVGADGTVDRNKLYFNVAGAGLGAKLPALQKSFADADKTASEIAKQKVELVDAKLKQSREYLATVKTPEQYIAWHEANHADPVLGPALAARGVTADQARASITEAINKPGGFEELLKKSALGIEKFTELNKPTVHVQNLGGTSRMTATPGLGGAPTVLSDTAITQSADSRASERTAAARLKFERSQVGKPVFNADAGGFITPPTKASPQGAITPLAGFVKPDKPLTESQGKATNFASRMTEAEAITKRLEKSGVNGSDFGTMAAGSVFTNWLASEEGQAYRQAQENWVTANLRQESGAAIPKDEMNKDIRKYFPVVGDKPEVIKQKARARETATKGMLVQAGPGAKQVPNIISDSAETPAQAEPATPPAKKTFAALPPARQYDGKRMKGEDGTIYKSTGGKWVKE